MTERPKVQQLAGRGNDPAGAVAPSAAVMRAQAALEARRAAEGVNYRPPGAVEPRAWFVRLAVELVRTDPADRGDVGALTPDPATTSTVGTIPIGFDHDHGGRVEDDHGGQDDRGAATVYPSLAAAFLASDTSAVGRLWLLLRAWDAAGRGFYDLDQVYQAFAGDGSPWRLGTRRRVQQLVKQGAGIFWTLRNPQPGRGGRFGGYTALQMTEPARVALALGVERLAGSPVAVPVADLLGGMHKANAALFAAAVTLRMRRERARPVTRETLAGMTGAAASTQRTYTRTANIEARPNYSVSSVGDVDGAGVFPFLDYTGQQGGRPGRTYLARHMPNSYAASLATRARGRMRKVNKRLNLVIYGARGERPKIDMTRIYHDTAGQAAAGFNRACNHDHYWRHGRTSAGADMWHVIEAL